MSLLDDYLHAVSLLLPRDQRDDITAELRDTILSQVEDRETTLGRPLTEAETEALLREIGHPVVVAARYRGGPQHLIGPTLYPYWAFVVKAAIVLQVAIATIVFLVRSIAVGDVGRALGEAIGSCVTGALTLVGVATVAAWLIERRRIRIDYLDNWRVHDLHLLRFVAWDWAWMSQRFDHWSRDEHGHRKAAQDSRRQAARAERTAWQDDRAGNWSSGMSPESATAGRGLGWIAGGTVLILWWLGVLHFGISADPAELSRIGLDSGPLARTDWAAVKAGLYGGVLAYAGLVIAQGMALLVRPHGVRLQGLFDVLRGLVVLALTAWLGFVSPIIDAIQVSGVADLVYRLEHLRLDDGRLALAPMLTVALMAIALGAAFRIFDGLWKLAVGGWTGTPAPGLR